jgi:hypothetical protein
MLLAVSTKQTTLYDQIRYSGNPGSFAWVLPIHGTVEVGLSSDVLFASVDTLTTTTIQSPPRNCPPPPVCKSAKRSNGAADAGASPSYSAADAGLPPVSVTKQENVGPYATVQLHPNSTDDPTAITKWLTDNGYVIGDDAKTIIGQYTKEGFDFLAMKLLPKEGVQAMRPVRVTFPGASLALPLRMAAIGTGASVGISIWVVADGRYEPQNFPGYRIKDEDLVWDFAVESSNYTTLRAQSEANLGGKGWEMESSITLNQQRISNVIESGGVSYGGYGGAPPANADDDYLPVEPDGPTPGKTAEDVRNEDNATLFAGMTGPNVRVTRMRSDIAHAAMSADLVLQASPDQSELSNVRVVTKSVNLVCPSYPTCEQQGLLPANAPDPSSSDDMGTGGCEAVPQPVGSGDLTLAAAFGISAVFRRWVRNRRNRRK